MKKTECNSCIYFSYFSVPGEVRLSSTLYIIMKIHNKRQLKNIALNRAADIDYKDFMKSYRKRKSEPYSFLTMDTTLTANNSLRFRKNLKIHKKNYIN